MKVLVTGATGFLGSHLCRELKKRNIDFCIISRNKSKNKWFIDNDIKVYSLDLTKEDGFSSLPDDITTVINLAAATYSKNNKIDYRDSIVISKNISKWSKNNGVSHFIHISSVTVDYKYLGDYNKGKKLSEEFLRRSQGLPLTVIKPSFICGFGSGQQEKLNKLLKMLPIIPIFGDNIKYPVYVDDAVSAIINCSERPDITIGKTYDIANTEGVSIKDFFRLSAECLGKKPIFIRLPLMPIFIVLRAINRLFPSFPIKANQLINLYQITKVDPKPAINELDFSPQRFEDFIIKSIIKE